MEDKQLIFHPDLGHLMTRQRKQPNLRNGNLLVGFRFVPTDVELIYYLQTKVGNWRMPLDTKKIIREVELSNFSPQQLTEMHKQQFDKDQKEWYFFTPRERKYPGGERPSRSAGDGYWKPTGKETMIEDNGAEVGSKKVLDFFHGKQPRGTKTNWKMHEYVLKDDNKFDRSHNPTTSQNRMELNKWVLCKIYEIKREKKKKIVDEAGAEDDNKQQNHGLGQGLCDNAKKNKQNPKQQDFGIAIKNSNIQIDASPCNSCLDDQSQYQLQLEGFHGHGQEMMRNICPPVGVPLISHYWPPANNSEWDLPNYEEAAGDCSSSMLNNNNNNNNRDIVFESFNLEDGLQYGLVGYPYNNNNNNNNNIQQGGAAASSFDDHQLLLLGGGGSNLAADDPNNNCCFYLNNQQPPLIDPHDLQQFGHNQQQQQQGASFDDPQHQFGVGGGGGGGGGDASSHQFGNSSGSNTIHKSAT
ncbi:hypothetical protein ACJIZ3_025848 [Penstemon smallii]|uniref:NAC domain-containing protein n=1 Tax=Penstemon smallii TaxID=265156 RepID=A0ABD3TWR1_9LAMI